MVSSQNASDGRGRILLIAGSATVAAFLAVGLVVYLLVPRALSVEYERYSDDRIAVDHPRGWQVEERTGEADASWGSTRFFPPEGDGDFPETAMAVGWYSDPAEEDARTESVQAWDQAVEELGLQDHVQEELDPAEYADAPRRWDAVVFEDTYTGLDHMAEDRGWEEDERFSLALQVHMADDGRTTAYWMAWYGPQSERGSYERVIRETLESFTPQA